MKYKNIEIDDCIVDYASYIHKHDADTFIVYIKDKLEKALEVYEKTKDSNNLKLRIEYLIEDLEF